MNAVLAVAAVLGVDLAAEVDAVFGEENPAESYERDIEASELLDASQREARREEELRLAARRVHLKGVRQVRRKEQRRTAKKLGHKLGHNNRRCKSCGAPRAVILETGARCPE